MPRERSYTLTVRYAETDAQGVVHHANYLIWFEEGRSEFLRQMGMNYSDIERAGFFVVVAHAEINYRAPAFYEDRVTVTTSIEKAHRRLLEFAYRAVNQDGVLLADDDGTQRVLDVEVRVGVGLGPGCRRHPLRSGQPTRHRCAPGRPDQHLRQSTRPTGPGPRHRSLRRRRVADQGRARKPSEHARGVRNPPLRGCRRRP